LTWPLNPMISHWRPLLEKHAAEYRDNHGDIQCAVPVPYLEAWMLHESGGNPCSLGIPGVEAGIFQTYHPDDDRYGATFSQLRACCSGNSQHPARPQTDEEAELQVTHGLAYVRAAAKAVRRELAQVGATWPEEYADFWCLVKLHHALPAIAAYFLPAFKRDHQRAPSSWSEFRKYVDGMDLQTFCARSSQKMAVWYGQRTHLLDNGEKTGNAAGQRLVEAF
jgi:hypothetical protein